MSYYLEQRKQDRQLKLIAKDAKKKALISLDETSSVLTVSGHMAKLFVDTKGYAPESALVPWSGNDDLLIDRFDVRAQLDSVPERGAERRRRKLDKGLEAMLNYERYRSILEARRFEVDEAKVIQTVDFEVKNIQLQGMGLSRSLVDRPHLDVLQETTMPRAQLNREAEAFGIVQSQLGYGYMDMLSFDREDIQLETYKRQDEMDHHDIVLNASGTHERRELLQKQALVNRFRITSDYSGYAKPPARGMPEGEYEHVDSDSDSLEHEDLLENFFPYLHYAIRISRDRALPKSAPAGASTHTPSVSLPVGMKETPAVPAPSEKRSLTPAERLRLRMQSQLQKAIQTDKSEEEARQRRLMEIESL